MSDPAGQRLTGQRAMPRRPVALKNIPDPVQRHDLALGDVTAAS